MWKRRKKIRIEKSERASERASDRSISFLVRQKRYGILEMRYGLV
jgi:hypothetical protein